MKNIYIKDEFPIYAMGLKGTITNFAFENDINIFLNESNPIKGNTENSLLLLNVTSVGTVKDLQKKITELSPNIASYKIVLYSNYFSQTLLEFSEQINASAYFTTADTQSKIVETISNVISHNTPFATFTQDLRLYSK